MRFQTSAILCSLLVFADATGILEDKSDIKDLLSTFALITDAKAFEKYGDVSTPDVIYNPSSGPVQGIPAAVAALQSIIPNSTITYSAITTTAIKFLPPFNKEGRSDIAEAISYAKISFFGSGNLTGEVLFDFAKFVDKEIVRTTEPGLGGWRIKNRKFVLVGEIGNIALLSLGKQSPKFL